MRSVKQRPGANDPRPQHEGAADSGTLITFQTARDE